MNIIKRYNHILWCVLFLLSPLHAATASRYYREGRKLYDRGELREALELFREGEKADCPNSLDYQLKV